MKWLAWLAWTLDTVCLVEDNGSGAVERPARGSMMLLAVACISCPFPRSCLFLYPYLDPMNG